MDAKHANAEEFAEGLEAIAALVRTGVVSLPYSGSLGRFYVFADTMEDLLAWRAMIEDPEPGAPGAPGSLYGPSVEGRIGGVRVLLSIRRTLATDAQAVA